MRVAEPGIQQRLGAGPAHPGVTLRAARCWPVPMRRLRRRSGGVVGFEHPGEVLVTMHRLQWPPRQRSVSVPQLLQVMLVVMPAQSRQMFGAAVVLPGSSLSSWHVGAGSASSHREVKQIAADGPVGPGGPGSSRPCAASVAPVLPGLLGRPRVPGLLIVPGRSWP